MAEETNACGTPIICLHSLIEAAVGAVRFSGVARTSEGSLALSAAAILLGAVLVNMVVAQINSTYNHVSKRGVLYYYKDLLDLRYLYAPD